MIRKALALLVTLAAVNLLFFTDWLRSDLQIPFFGTIGFFLFILAANIVIHLLQNSKVKKQRIFSLITSGLAIIYSLVAVFRASFFDIGLLNLFSIALTFISLYFVIAQKIPFNSWLDILLSPLLIFYGWLKGVISATNDIPNIHFLGNKMKASKGQFSYFILGVFLLVPVMLVLVGLLSSADPVFASQIQNLFNFQIPRWLINRGLFTLGALALVTPFLYAKLTDRGYKKEDIDQVMGKMTVTALVVVVPVAIILGLFLLIQSHYLFAKVEEIELIQFGVRTYSEYVRRGFAELILVSIITFATSVSSLIIFLNRKKSNTQFLKYVNTILLVEIIIFIISIFRRVYLYQELHGLTRARVYGSGFLILMIVLTVILILRHYAPKIKWHLYEMGIIALFILVITTIGVDSIIAKNAPPTVNNEVDYVYITRLSPDAIDRWNEAFEHAKFEIDNYPSPLNDDQKRKVVYAMWTFNSLVENYEQINKHADFGDIRNFSHAQWNARNYYNLYLDYSKLTEYQKKANEIYNTFRDEPRNYLDRSENTPLLN